MHKPSYSNLPSKLITVFVLIGTLLSGSLINNVHPMLNDIFNVTALVSNCTELSVANKTTAALIDHPELLSSTDNVWTLLMPILLPIVYIFFVDGKFALDEKKIKSLYQHCTGQIMSFSSSEIIRHFIVVPSSDFPLRCNLTEATCQNYYNEMTNTSLLCQNSSYPTKQIFDSLHSMPNATAALLGSSTIFLLCHLKSKTNVADSSMHYSPFAEINHPLCSKYKFFSQQLWKSLCLCVFFATIYFCLWQTLISNTAATMQELTFSFGYGVIVQLTVQKNKKYNNSVLNFMPTTTPNASTPPPLTILQSK